MRSLGLTPREYASFARADQGVLAAHKWFDMAGYEQMWQQRMGTSKAAAAGSSNTGSGSNGDAAAAANNSNSGGVGARYAYQEYTAPAEHQIFDW